MAPLLKVVRIPPQNSNTKPPIKVMFFFHRDSFLKLMNRKEIQREK